MEKSAFIDLVKTLITPLFTGCEIIGEEESNSRDNEVAVGASGILLCKMDKNDDYRIVLKRVLPFKNSDAKLVKSILNETKTINDYNIIEEGHKRSLQLYSLEKAICKTVCEYSYETLHTLISLLNTWGSRTYEGQPTTFGFVINDTIDSKQEDVADNLHISKILTKDFSALICDGIFSCLELDCDGYMLNHITIPQLGFADTYSPFEFVNMAHQCYINRIGLTLQKNGDMLIFKEQELVFARRRGQWSSFSHDEIMAKLALKPTEQNYDLRKSVYLTALDTAFAKCGGCIAYLKKDNGEAILNHIDCFDIVSEKYYEIKKQIEYEKISNSQDLDELLNFQETYKDNFKEFIASNKALKAHTIHKLIRDRKFNELPRIFRQELVGIDGATIIDSEGEIVAVGAIIKINAGSSGGGRLAAAKQLSEYGVALKISADGTIEGFSYDKNTSQSKAIFSAG